eukprot:320552-Chlamydomonas_euryale.AAC.29
MAKNSSSMVVIYLSKWRTQASDTPYIWRVLDSRNALFLHAANHKCCPRARMCFANSDVSAGDGSVPAPFSYDGVTVWGERTNSLSYDISATNLACGFKRYGQFCPMYDSANDIPDFLPQEYRYWTLPYCYDVAPDTQYTCGQQAVWGKCDEKLMFENLTPYVALVGSYCAATCGRCTAGEPICADMLPPASGGHAHICSKACSSMNFAFADCFHVI